MIVVVVIVQYTNLNVGLCECDDTTLAGKKRKSVQKQRKTNSMGIGEHCIFVCVLLCTVR